MHLVETLLVQAKETIVVFKPTRPCFIYKFLSAPVIKASATDQLNTMYSNINYYLELMITCLRG